jgi:pimeloyl-ACP methyl ester carboxylesterase
MAEKGGMIRTAVMAVLITAAIACSSCGPAQQTAPKDATVTTPVQDTWEGTWLRANDLRLKATIYKSARLSAHPILVAVLHGDLLDPGSPAAHSPPSYHYVFAGRAAEQIDDVIVAALVRPGYADYLGDQSTGRKGMRTGDNYTPEVVDAIAAALDELKAKIHPAATVMAGHSGGAAITGILLGRHPSDVNAALLVSCPCDVPAWRRHMIRETFKQVGPLSLVFTLPTTSLSPVDLASQVPTSTRVRMVVGSQDATAPPRFTEEYADALRKRGVEAAVTIAPGLEHNILLEPVVIEQLKQLVEATQRER